MALYFGSEKQRANIGGLLYRLEFYSTSILNGLQLRSSEGYILKDSNGLYLTTKEVN